MTAIMMGNIAEAIVRSVATAVPRANVSALRASVDAVIPRTGIIIDATGEELRELGGILFNEVIVQKKKGDQSAN